MGGAIGYFAVAMLMEKSFRLPKSVIIGFAAFVLVLAVGYYLVAADVFNIAGYIPGGGTIEATVKGYDVGTLTVGRGSLTPEQARELHKRAIAEKDIEGSRSIYLDVSYDMGGNYTINRKYVLLDDSNRPGSAAELLFDISSDIHFFEMKNQWIFNAEVYSIVYVNDEERYVFDADTQPENVRKLMDALKQEIEAAAYRACCSDGIYIYTTITVHTSKGTESFDILNNSPVYNAVKDILEI